MTRLEKCELLKFKGYTYDKETGKIFGVRGKEIIRKTKGYIILENGLLGHHFAWFMTYENVDFVELDHKNRVRNDNRISNLRISTKVQQNQNTNAKGYNWHEGTNKWRARIYYDKKQIHLGLFNTEEEARNAYLEAKKKYHII
jgi:hypothetical protein